YVYTTQHRWKNEIYNVETCSWAVNLLPTYARVSTIRKAMSPPSTWMPWKPVERKKTELNGEEDIVTPWWKSSVYSKAWPETKIAPRMKVTVYHSIIPQPAMLKTEPSRRLRGGNGLPHGKRPSAMKTPIWHVTELNTRIDVFSRANPCLKLAWPSAKVSGAIERRVKSIANRPPKNISSLDSQTRVPICVGFGRPTAGEAAAEGRSVRV